MNEDRRLQIAKLATAETRARERYNMLGFANTAGLSAEEREEQDRNYALALAEWKEARDKLAAATDSGPR